MEVKQTKLPKSQIELEFELTEVEFKEHIEHALGHMKKHIKIDGFRPGQAPNKLVEDRVKPESLLMEAGDCAVRETYSKYMKENDLQVVGEPEVSIVKVAQGSPFVFKAIVTVLPDVELPDYKKIASTVKRPKGYPEVVVTDEEVRHSLNYLQKNKAKFTAKEGAAEKLDFVEIKYQNKNINDGKDIDDKFVLGEGGFMPGFENAIIGMKAGEEKEVKIKFPENAPRKDLAGTEGDFKIKVVSIQKMELPKLDDTFAKDMGGFDKLEQLETSIKEGITAEKIEAEKQRIRGEYLEKIAAEAKIEMPELMVQHEQKRLLDGLKNKITQEIKIPFKEYLASVKQTEDELKETYKKEAEKRIKGYLVLKEIGKKEGLEVTDKEVEEDVEKATKTYTKEQLKQIDINQLKEYTKGVIYNEKVFKLLEDSSKRTA